MSHKRERRMTDSDIDCTSRHYQPTWIPLRCLSRCIQDVSSRILYEVNITKPRVNDVALPRTWLQSVGIVASNSYIVIVNAKRIFGSEKASGNMGRRKRTVRFIVCLHEYEWVVLNVAVEVDVRSVQLESASTQLYQVPPTQCASTSGISPSMDVGRRTEEG
jgi:hypothetical protein